MLTWHADWCWSRWSRNQLGRSLRYIDQGYSWYPARHMHVRDARQRRSNQRHALDLRRSGLPRRRTWTRALEGFWPCSICCRRWQTGKNHVIMGIIKPANSFCRLWKVSNCCAVMRASFRRWRPATPSSTLLNWLKAWTRVKTFLFAWAAEEIRTWTRLRRLWVFSSVRFGRIHAAYWYWHVYTS